MRIAALAAVLFTVLAGPAGAQTPGRVLQLSFDADGRVTLRAQHVTPREILAEWARQCGCYLVNAEKLPGDAITIPLLFERQPQALVLGSLLRTAAGYVLTPRREPSGGPSQYETIYILATSNPTSGAYPASVSTIPVPVPISTPGSPDNEIPPVAEITTQPPNSPTQAPESKPAGTPTSGMPSSVFVPIVPAPSNPFSAPAPTRGGGPPPGHPPAPPQTPAPGGRVGANP